MIEINKFIARLQLNEDIKHGVYLTKKKMGQKPINIYELFKIINGVAYYLKKEVGGGYQFYKWLDNGITDTILDFNMLDRPIKGEPDMVIFKQMIDENTQPEY